MIPDQQKKIICDDAFAAKVRAVVKLFALDLISGEQWNETLLALRAWLGVALALPTDRGGTLGQLLGGIDPEQVATPALAETCCYVAAVAPLVGLTEEGTKAAIEVDESTMAEIDAILMQ